MKRLLVLCLSLPAVLFAQFGPVIQDEEPREGFIQYAEGIVLPMESAGYTLYLPETTAEGTIVFFNSDRDTTASIIPLALEEEVAVLFVATGNRLDFLFADSTLTQLDRYIGTALQKNDLPKDKLLLAGMSLAGTRALKYAQFCGAGRSTYGIRPRVVAICDAPLDMIRFWRSSETAEQRVFHYASANEGRWVSSYLEKNLGGGRRSAPAPMRIIRLTATRSQDRKS